MSVYNVSGARLTACYDASGNALPSIYDVNGNLISDEIKTDYSAYSATAFKTISTANTQGMEVYNGVLFQFRGSTSNLSINDLVCLYDWDAETAIYSNMAIDSGHSNAVAFSKTFYDENDEFPLLYCGDWFEPIVHVNRITRTGATHLYDIVMDVSDTGYYPNPCIDFENEIMYTVGYYKQSTSDSTGNHCIVCEWDLSNMTDNGDGTRSPQLLGSYTRDYIFIMQDLKFSDGYVWITAGGQNQAEYLHAMSPDTGVFDYTITMPITTEIEGLVWMRDGNGLYYAYIGFQGGVYYKVTFARK